MKIRPLLLCVLLFLTLSPRASFSQSEKSPTASPLSFQGVARLVKIARHGKTYQADATYPRFLVLTPVTRLANWKLHTEAQKGVAGLVNQARADAKQIREMKIPAYGSDSTPSLHFYAPKRLVSVAVMGYSYLGGAHGNYGTDAKNYGLLRGETRPRELNLGDFFRAGSPYRARVEKMLLTKLRATKGAEKEATFVVDGSVKTLPTALLNNFAVEKGGLRWFFPPYAVGPYAVGEFEVKLSSAQLGTDFQRAMLRMP